MTNTELVKNALAALKQIGREDLADWVKTKGVDCRSIKQGVGLGVGGVQ